ncbi:uncharacterized protein TNCV_3319321 [Trichonephila clavipes]|nr:uncharacterized protein TNCV_3319321 [Trichonephila clavipes]
MHPYFVLNENAHGKERETMFLRKIIPEFSLVWQFIKTIIKQGVDASNGPKTTSANPQVYVETPLHPEKLTVWCALWVGGIIGPYFFKNDEGHNVTVNGDRYRAMITNFFIPELNSHDVQELWFQQDGATCHTARATIDLLKGTFGDRLISRFGPVNWPPRSCDRSVFDQVSQFDRGRIVDYRDCGLSFTTVMRICDRWMQEGTTDRRGRSHPPQCTTSREDRKIVRIAVTDR